MKGLHQGAPGKAPVLVNSREDLQHCGPRILAGYDYWTGLCARHDTLPKRSDIRPQEISSLLSRLVLVDLYRDDRFEPVFRLVGTRFEELNGIRLTGGHLRELYRPAEYEEMAATFRAMIGDAMPRYLESELWRPGREMYRIRRLMLPLAGPQGEVRLILAFVDESPSPHGLAGP